ncbi:MAG: thioredoxin domain-containing protein [Chloroflexi bacterium]|nr:thioredoxin domain-containing protein [Chloroflexota bacterium]
MEETYVATGKVRFIYHHMAFIGEESIRAAEATECAGEQGALWRYMDTLFANQHGENQGAFADQYLKAFASEMGLDQLKFNTCLDSRRYRTAVLQETQEGRARGVQSTPSFFINGELIKGLLPFEGFKEKIDAALGG